MIIIENNSHNSCSHFNSIPNKMQYLICSIEFEFLLRNISFTSESIFFYRLLHEGGREAVCRKRNTTHNRRQLGTCTDFNSVSNTIPKKTKGVCLSVRTIVGFRSDGCFGGIRTKELFGIPRKQARAMNIQPTQLPQSLHVFYSSTTHGSLPRSFVVVTDVPSW